MRPAARVVHVGVERVEEVLEEHDGEVRIEPRQLLEAAARPSATLGRDGEACTTGATGAWPALLQSCMRRLRG